MKKFLFTLAALMMAGSLCAEEYLYIPDFEVKQDELGTEIEVAVSAHFDAAVSAWDVYFTYPEGLTCTGVEKGDDWTIATYNNRGRAIQFDAPLYGATEPYDHLITAIADAGYNEDKTTYGCVKWLAGDYEYYLTLYFEVAEDFQGGQIAIKTMPACGADNREGVVPCEKNKTYEKVCNVTVEGGQVVPEVTDAPVITYVVDEEAETVTITATGNGTVILYNDDVEVARGEGVATYVVPFTEDPEGEEMGFSATAQEEGKEVSEYALATIVIPGKQPVVPEVTEAPVITWTVDNEAETVTITATGNGTVILYNDDVEVARGEGVATYVVPFTEDPEGEEMGFSATAQEEGKEVSEYALATVEIPGKQPVVPEVTEAPVINVEITDDAYIITATGEGEVVLYVNDEPVENPYTIARGEEDQTIYVYATAQEEGKEMGTTDVQPIVVEAKAGETPVDPHMTGYWIVTIDQYGNEVWKELLPDNGDYTGIVRFEYADYGTFPYDPNKTEEENNAMRPNVEYYVYVDGVRYGAAEDGTLTVLGEALNNPLFEGENNYVLANASGRVYNMGVAIDNATNSMYVYAAVAYYTDVNEMNADKAVAGVRYFNMAGQEMQEANGMTIVVTTYTDGTTSAVKVMK